MQKSTCTQCLQKKATLGGSFRGDAREWFCADCSDEPAKLRAVEKFFAKRVQAMGGDFRHAKWPGRKGGPTHAALLPGRLLMVWVGEPESRAEVRRFEASGVAVAVVRTSQEVDAAIGGVR